LLLAAPAKRQRLFFILFARLPTTIQPPHTTAINPLSSCALELEARSPPPLHNALPPSRPDDPRHNIPTKKQLCNRQSSSLHARARAPQAQALVVSRGARGGARGERNDAAAHWIAFLVSPFPPPAPSGETKKKPAPRPPPPPPKKTPKKETKET
jgi:hypothetical protein